jgi:glutamine---fructose-6-phosphate transaminase (isomerizing)
MCGIIGILGKHEVSPQILDALKRLEYRGYDSAGIATISGGKLDLRRAVGKLINLSDTMVHAPLPGALGLGIRAGPPMAAPLWPMPTRTGRAGWRWCITA